MSRQFRYRMAALGLCGLIFGAPLVANGTASADQVEANDRQVSFGGFGVFGLSCGSRPSVEAMTVPASSVVRVVNQTGHDAQLRLAGAPRGVIPADGAAEVVFRRGTTAVMLTPECSFGEDVMPMLITAAPSASFEEPGPTPEPFGGGSPGVMSKPAAGSGSPSRTSGSILPDSVAPVSEPTRTRSKDSRRGAHKAAEQRSATAPRTSATAAKAAPHSGINPRIKSRSLRSTAGIGAPAFAGMPPGGADVAQGGRESVVPPAPPEGRVASPAADEDGGVPALEPTEPGSFDAAQPVAAVGRIDDGRPLGLLGLTALVCILGVATAAIRAIVSQRASRTNVA
ncbi:hypothetical protein [Actinoplanes subglobosus]|uniref:Uncharacterized protein n=1 Tax=Actinoplanes subglobosus TaxID=1547892 RepID=A0ABV8ISR6_9ACTN